MLEFLGIVLDFYQFLRFRKCNSCWIFLFELFFWIGVRGVRKDFFRRVVVFYRREIGEERVIGQGRQKLGWEFIQEGFFVILENFQFWKLVYIWVYRYRSRKLVVLGSFRFLVRVQVVKFGSQCLMFFFFGFFQLDVCFKSRSLLIIMVMVFRMYLGFYFF